MWLSFHYSVYVKQQGCAQVDPSHLAHRYVLCVPSQRVSWLTIPQLELLEDLDILEDGYSISRLSADEPLEEVIPEDLVILLRTLTLPLEEINRLKSKGKPPKPAFGFEEAALLSTAVAQRQAEYTTSIQEDQWLLSQSPDAATMDKFRIRRRQMAIQVRKGEKEILAQLLERLQDSRSVDARNGTRKRTAADTASQSKKQRTH